MAALQIFELDKKLEIVYHELCISNNVLETDGSLHAGCVCLWLDRDSTDSHFTNVARLYIHVSELDFLKKSFNDALCIYNSNGANPQSILLDNTVHPNDMNDDFLIQHYHLVCGILKHRSLWPIE